MMFNLTEANLTINNTFNESIEVHQFPDAVIFSELVTMLCYCYVFAFVFWIVISCCSGCPGGRSSHQ